MIVPSEDGRLRILLNSAVTQPERQNFSICHEIAHTFFPDCAEFIRMREKGQGKADPDREVEVLCNIAASELLLPVDHFLDSLKEFGFSLSSVPPLSGRFLASKSATVIKMVNTGIKVCAAVFLEPGRRKSISIQCRDNTLKMRVVYVVNNILPEVIARRSKRQKGQISFFSSATLNLQSLNIKMGNKYEEEI